MASATDFLLVEAEEIRKAKESLRGILFGVFGAYLPVLVSIFGLAASSRVGSTVDMRTVATLFIVVASLSAMWVQYLWIEYLSYMNYYYLDLLPRIHLATGEASGRSFLSWTLPRSARQLLPLALFNIGSFVVMFSAYWTYVRGAAHLVVESLCVGFLVAAVVSVASVLLELRSLQRAMLATRADAGVGAAVPGR
jgi:hypothetical protein